MSAKFNRLAPSLTDKLCRDLDISAMDAFAILGNLGHESGGFEKLQEITPTVKGSRGGWGWAQWTGIRRRNFEAWAKKRGHALDSDEANYVYLIHELTNTSERAAIPKLKAATTLRDKVIAFENAFLRAGIKHHDSRYQWALRAQQIVMPGMLAPSRSLPADPVKKPDANVWITRVLFVLMILAFIAAIALQGAKP